MDTQSVCACMYLFTLMPVHNMCVFWGVCAYYRVVDCREGEYANAEAQFGSSGPVHAVGEVEKEESYRTELQLFSLRTFTVASAFH